MGFVKQSGRSSISFLLFLFFASAVESRSHIKNGLVASVPSAHNALRTHGGDGGAAVKKNRIAIGTGLVLALNSGFVNGCTLSGFLGDKQPTAAVTGGWTNSAIGFAAGTDQFASQAKVILGFIGGSTIASLLNPNPVAFDFSPKSYQPALLTASVLLAVATKLAQDNNKLYLVLCAVANGIQNSVTSVSTGNLCRTSHYSGISSDMGTFLGQILRGNNTNKFKLKVFASLALSFWMGGLLSYYIARDKGPLALVIPSTVYFLMGTGTVHKMLGA